MAWRLHVCHKSFILAKNSRSKLFMEVKELEKLIREKEGSLSLAFPALMRKVYVWMTLALVITGITAYGVASSPNIMMWLVQTPAILWGLIIAELALVLTDVYKRQIKCFIKVHLNFYFTLQFCLCQYVKDRLPWNS